jgi:hypothetical protein
VKEKWELWHIIKVRRDKMIGYIIRDDSLTKNVIEGSIWRGIHEIHNDRHRKG